MGMGMEREACNTDKLRQFDCFRFEFILCFLTIPLLLFASVTDVINYKFMLSGNINKSARTKCLTARK